MSFPQPTPRATRRPRPHERIPAGLAGLTTAALAITLALGACADSPTQPREELAPLRVTAQVAGTPIATIAITVTGADFARPLVFNLRVTDGLAAGTLHVPPGHARTFTALGFDAAGEVTHEGSATADVLKGDNPPLAIQMLPRTGRVPVTITIGEVGIGVTPASVALDVGQTRQLAAAVTYDNGQPVLGAAPAWASSNPAVASVDQTGLVTARAVGRAEVMAVFNGVAGASVVTVSAAPPPAPGANIAFTSYRDGNAEIYFIGADGTNLTRLTNNAAPDVDPAWSPDRSRIAFSSGRDGVSTEIYVMNADGTAPVRLTNNGMAADQNPAWSPDGTRIVYQNTGGPEPYKIFVLNADGSGTPTLLTDDYWDNTDPAWSPDGARIAFASARGNGRQIHVMNADGTNVVRLTNDSPAFDSEPAWSPDGTRIAFLSSRDFPGNTSSEIYVMNADGTNPMRLTSNTVSENHPAWSSDGRYIAFASNRDGNWEIYVMNADGTNQTRLTTNATADMDPAWR